MQTIKTSSLWVVLGEHTHSTSGETNLTMKYAVDRIKIHRNNKGKPSQVDIALLRVKGQIDIDVYTPLCLPSPDFNVRGDNITLTGWGLLNCPTPLTNPYCTGGVPATTLQEITLPVVSHDTCKQIIGSYGNGKVFCWGGDLGQSGCFGDSGSPLIHVSQSGQYSLVGSVQGGTGPGCGAAGTYGIAWETARYRQWYLGRFGANIQSTPSIIGYSCQLSFVMYFEHASKPSLRHRYWGGMVRSLALTTHALEIEINCQHLHICLFIRLSSILFSVEITTFYSSVLTTAFTCPPRRRRWL